jgi:DNA-binding transcriptional LysR family regulator
MDIKSLDLNLLVALDALLSELNVTKAARRLRISQPALSARLNKLRVIFDDSLLLPSQRGMIPTQRAIEIQEPLRLAIEQLLSVAAAGERFDARTAKLTVSIAASDYMHCALLLPLLPSLRREAPFLRIALRLIDGARVWEQMERGDVDIGLMTPDTAPPQLRARPLWKERYVGIARAGHPSVRGEIDLETFCSLEHVIVSPRGSGFVGPADAALKKLGFARRDVLSVNGFLLVPGVVAHSDLVALVPERLMREHSADLQIFEPPVPVPGFSISIVWHDRTSSTPGQRWLRERLAAAAT